MLAGGLPQWLRSKEATCSLGDLQETWVQSLGWQDSLEEEMATHSSILAWKIPWTEKPGGLQSMGWQRVEHNLATEHTCSLSWKKKNLKQSRENPEFFEYVHWWIYPNSLNYGAKYAGNQTFKISVLFPWYYTRIHLGRN